MREAGHPHLLDQSVLSPLSPPPPLHHRPSFERTYDAAARAGHRPPDQPCEPFPPAPTPREAAP
ncbi:hypothetical protein CU044_4048 [Streptomyces sp. L-9-10]|nr:hypothetical protein CU044_4048 [Streptomyces sp. L-9-10]